MELNVSSQLYSSTHPLETRSIFIHVFFSSLFLFSSLLFSLFPWCCCIMSGLQVGVEGGGKRGGGEGGTGWGKCRLWLFLLVQMGNDSRTVLRLLLRLLFVGCCCCCLNTYFTLLYCSSYVVVGHRIRDSMSRTLRIRSASLSNFEGLEKNRFPHKTRTDPNISSYFNARSCRARTPSH